MKYTPLRIVAPAAPLVSQQEARDHLRVDGIDDGPLIALLVDAVEAHLDGWSGVLGRCLRAQTWAIRADDLSDLRLPFPDVQSAVIHYLDVDGQMQTLPAGNYRIGNDVAGGYVTFAAGVAQSEVSGEEGAVLIEAVFGMAVVPGALKAAGLVLLGHLYEDREGAGGVPPAVAALLAPYRHWRI